MALMLLAHAHGLIVTAIHVDHGLRTESASDIDVIDPVAESLGISVIVHSVQVEHGPNLEARARAARYGVMPDNVMTGHTADDQAETVLINLLRGAGAQGLGAMRPGFTRPLLALRRSDTHAVCAAAGIAGGEGEREVAALGGRAGQRGTDDRRHHRAGRIHRQDFHRLGRRDRQGRPGCHDALEVPTRSMLYSSRTPFSKSATRLSSFSTVMMSLLPV